MSWQESAKSKRLKQIVPPTHSFLRLGIHIRARDSSNAESRLTAEWFVGFTPPLPPSYENDD